MDDLQPNAQEVALARQQMEDADSFRLTSWKPEETRWMKSAGKRESLRRSRESLRLKQRWRQRESAWQIPSCALPSTALSSG